MEQRRPSGSFTGAFVGESHEWRLSRKYKNPVHYLSVALLYRRNLHAVFLPLLYRRDLHAVFLPLFSPLLCAFYVTGLFYHSLFRKDLFCLLLQECFYGLF